MNTVRRANHNEQAIIDIIQNRAEELYSRKLKEKDTNYYETDLEEQVLRAILDEISLELNIEF